MKQVLLLTVLLALAAEPGAKAQADEPMIVTANDHHEYASADHVTMIFPKKLMTLRIDYKNSPLRQVAKISVDCMKRHRSLSFDRDYFAAPLSPMVDRQRDKAGRVEALYFSLDMRSNKNLRENDRTFRILCTKDKIEFTMLGEETSPLP